MFFTVAHTHTHPHTQITLYAITLQYISLFYRVEDIIKQLHVDYS